MSVQKVDDAAWIANPTTWRNNRGSYKPAHGGYIVYGLPPPPHGRKEDDESMAGGDRVGWRNVVITPDMVGRTLAVFLNIEEKTVNDRLKPGQRKWHNFVIESGGLSEIWQEKKDGSIEITDKEIK